MPNAIRLNRAAKKVLVVSNPNAGSHRNADRLSALQSALEASPYELQMVFDLNVFESQVKQAQAEGSLRAVVAAGGDGTFAEVLNRSPAGTPLAVYPLGTENLLARYVQQKADPERFIRLLDDGVLVKLDAGKADDRLFAVVFSAGFDAKIVEELGKRRQGNITHLSYVRPILNAMWQYTFHPIRVRCNSNDCLKESRWFFAFNLPQYAWKMPFTPDANGIDGLLDVCQFTKHGISSGFRYLWKVIRGIHSELPDTQISKTSGFRLETDGDNRIPYELDGDPGGVLPVDVSVVARRMTLLVSQETSRQLGFDL